VGDVTVVHLIDTRAAVFELLDLLENAIDNLAMGRIVLNLGGIPRVSSAALGKLLKLNGRAGALEGRLKLCELHPDVRHVLRITRLDQIFEIHDLEDEALASFAEDESPADAVTLASR
jgi:anti-sigma B factor antagonist